MAREWRLERAAAAGRGGLAAAGVRPSAAFPGCEEADRQTKKCGGKECWCLRRRFERRDVESATYD
jgi:hypothetical protein